MFCAAICTQQRSPSSLFRSLCDVLVGILLVRSCCSSCGTRRTRLPPVQPLWNRLVLHRPQSQPKRLLRLPQFSTSFCLVKLGLNLVRCWVTKPRSSLLATVIWVLHTPAAMCLWSLSWSTSGRFRVWWGQRGVVEHHQDGFPHVHVLVQRRAHPSPLAAERFVIDYEGRQFRCKIRNLATIKHQHNWHYYLQKEGEPTEWGRYRPVVQHSHHDFIAIARERGISSACEQWLSAGGSLERLPNWRRGLECMMPDPTPRWTILPVELEFFIWQRRVLICLIHDR